MGIRTSRTASESVHDTPAGGAVESGPPEPAPGPGPLVSVSHLVRSYGPRRAVDDVSFELGPGVTGLLGPNGAGKSTLVRCLAGLSSWDAGEVRIAGIDPTWHAADARKAVGFMPERVSFPPEMRVAEYLRFAAEVKGVRRSERAGVVETALGRAGLSDVRTRILSNLSKGYRQRVGLAQALLADPPVVVLDEPSAGLDPLNVIEIRTMLRSYARDRAILVSTHVLPETRLLCDRVLVMSQGKLVYDGTTAGMTQAARNRYRARLRLRPAGRLNGAVPPVDVSGTSLVESREEDGDVVLVVDAEGEAPLGALVGRLSAAGWLVYGVEPAADALEDAFRTAVFETAAPADAEAAP